MLFSSAILSTCFLVRRNVAYTSGDAKYFGAYCSVRACCSNDKKKVPSFFFAFFLFLLGVQCFFLRAHGYMQMKARRSSPGVSGRLQFSSRPSSVVHSPRRSLPASIILPPLPPPPPNHSRTARPQLLPSRASRPSPFSLVHSHPTSSPPLPITIKRVQRWGPVQPQFALALHCQFRLHGSLYRFRSG